MMREKYDSHVKRIVDKYKNETGLWYVNADLYFFTDLGQTKVLEDNHETNMALWRKWLNIKNEICNRKSTANIKAIREMNGGKVPSGQEIKTAFWLVL